MEKETEIKTGIRTNTGILLSPSEAEEYCQFKREKRIEEIKSFLSRSVINCETRNCFIQDLKKYSEVAKKICCSSIKIYPSKICIVKNFLVGSSTVIDCIIGGNGETLPKVKVYEAKLAIKNGAKEITLIVSYSAFKSGKIYEIKKEIKKIRRVSKKIQLKLYIDKDFTFKEIIKLTEIVSDGIVNYISVPFGTDCVELKRAIKDNCKIEVRGVETSIDYKNMIEIGVDRIVTSHAEEIYNNLIKEALNCSFALPFDKDETSVKVVSNRTEYKKDTDQGSDEIKNDSKEKTDKKEKIITKIKS